MRANVLKFTIEIQYPTKFFYQKLSKFVSDTNYPSFINYKLEMKDEITNNLKEQYLHDTTGIYTTYTSGHKIARLLKTLSEE